MVTVVGTPRDTVESDLVTEWAGTLLGAATAAFALAAAGNVNVIVNKITPPNSAAIPLRLGM
jgi:hypothetical protein